MSPGVMVSEEGEVDWNGGRRNRKGGRGAKGERGEDGEKGKRNRRERRRGEKGGVERQGERREGGDEKVRGNCIKAQEQYALLEGTRYTAMDAGS